MFQTLEKLGYTLVGNEEGVLFFEKPDLSGVEVVKTKIGIDKKKKKIWKFKTVGDVFDYPSKFTSREIQAIARMGF